jgi:hypothetical protein
MTDMCARCNEPTHEPHPEWDWPKLPPVDLIRKLAHEVGYAIGEHGSKERDLDVIAAPWTNDAVNCDVLLSHLARGLDARIVDEEQKPHGRIAATIQMNGWYRHIDISVYPIIELEDENV